MKTKELIDLHVNVYGYTVASVYDSVGLTFHDYKFMGYSKRAVINRLRDNGVKVSNKFLNHKMEVYR